MKRGEKRRNREKGRDVGIRKKRPLWTLLFSIVLLLSLQLAEIKKPRCQETGGSEKLGDCKKREEQ